MNPRDGINEDPVSGSAFTYLVPNWAGLVRCTLAAERVRIAGRAVKFLEGLIEVNF